jgi:hypothetical protein
VRPDGNRAWGKEQPGFRRVQSTIDFAMYVAVWIVAAHLWGAGYGFLAFVVTSGLHDISAALRCVAQSIEEQARVQVIVNGESQQDNAGQGP